MPSLTQLKYILAVHREGHFGRAAEQCHVSQPSLSIQVQKLEEELGLVIFDREKKPILTTDKGRQIIEQAQRVIQEHKRLFILSEEKGAVRGEFRLGIIPTLSPYILPLFVESFCQNYPDVQLRIHELETQELVKALKADELESGLLVTPLKDEGITERILFWEPFFAYVSEKHELADRKMLKEKDLKEYPVWLLKQGHCFRNQVLNICGGESKNQVLANAEFESGSLETLINLVRRGRGYTLVPYLSTLGFSKAERESRLKKFQRPLPTREVSLIYSRNFYKSAIIEALINEIQNNLPPQLAKLGSSEVEVVPIEP